MARIVFMGTSSFAVPVLRGLIDPHEVVAVITRPDRPAGRGRRLSTSPVKSLAVSRGLTVVQPPTLRDEDVQLRLRELRADLFVVTAFGQILPSRALAIPARGSLNVHASLLPRHRGTAPIPFSILEGDTTTGVTVMLMDEGIDTGPILAQRSIAIHRDDTTGSLGERLARLGRDVLIESIPLWLRGEIRPRRQDEQKASYTRLLTKRDGLINWSLSAIEVWHRSRAFRPWPGAYTYWRSKSLKILRCRPSLENTVEVRPGLVVEGPEGVAVGTGHGLVVLEEVQLSGRRALSCSDFACGQADFVGSVLGKEREQ